MSESKVQPMISRYTLDALKSGKRVFGHFQMVRQLGKGSFGEVWLARDIRHNLNVALKFLPTQLADTASGRDDLYKEAGQCKQLSHPNIVRVFDCHEEKNEGIDLLAISMEYVDGESLEKSL